MATTRKIRRRKTTRVKYRSGLEERVAALLPNPELYETQKITYVQEHVYTPDFPLSDGTFVEAKGYFDAADRAKHLRIREQGITVRFIFSRSNNKIHRSSKTTYADWCEKHGFEYCDIKDAEHKIKEWCGSTKNSKN